jgi:hypothetical protein
MLVPSAWVPPRARTVRHGLVPARAEVRLTAADPGGPAETGGTFPSTSRTAYAIDGGVWARLKHFSRQPVRFAEPVPPDLFIGLVSGAWKPPAWTWDLLYDLWGTPLMGEASVRGTACPDFGAEPPPGSRLLDSEDGAALAGLQGWLDGNVRMGTDAVYVRVPVYAYQSESGSLRLAESWGSALTSEGFAPVSPVRFRAAAEAMRERGFDVRDPDGDPVAMSGLPRVSMETDDDIIGMANRGPALLLRALSRPGVAEATGVAEARRRLLPYARLGAAGLVRGDAIEPALEAVRDADAIRAVPEGVGSGTFAAIVDGEFLPRLRGRDAGRVGDLDGLSGLGPR